MKSKVLPDELDEVELWNREDASELERPKALNKYQIVVASRDWTVETIVRQVEQEQSTSIPRSNGGTLGGITAEAG